MKKVLVCGVANSENLGDRIIAETINYILKSANEDLIVSNFDFTSGKLKEFQLENNINLNSNDIRKKMIPNSLRSLKVYLQYKRNKMLATDLKENIKSSDLILIGGGHLLIDNYLNFPLGIKNIINESRLHNKPVTFCFVGAKGPWSAYATKQLFNAFDYADYISVRDRGSKEFLTSLKESLNDKIVVLSDPALFVNEICEIKKDTSGQKKIGLGIMDPYEAKKRGISTLDRRASAKWWSSLAIELVSKGYEVNIFTNGAPTDNGFVEYFIKPKLEALSNVAFGEYPKHFQDVLNVIKEQDLVVAQRLHACIPSISFKNHTFGVKWDEKVEKVFKELGLGGYLINNNDDINEIVGKIEDRLHKNLSLDPIILEKIKSKREEMMNFARKIGKAN